MVEWLIRRYESIWVIVQKKYIYNIEFLKEATMDILSSKAIKK